MCGISGIIDHHPVTRNLVTSIANLEYRGYDSCGMALLNGKGIEVRKNTGGVQEVRSREKLDNMTGNLGIAHTRWATHGGVTPENAHPHLSQSGDFAIVHNGIISNYQKLRERLIGEGIEFRSTTDSEVFVNLVEEAYEQKKDVLGAFLEALKQIQGTYSIVLLSAHDPENLYCVKQDSPLIIGLGEGCNYIGSDINAFLEHTRKAVVLDDGEFAVISRDSYEISDVGKREEREKSILQIDWDTETTKKGGFSHYMIKEIFDEPQTARQALDVPQEQISQLVEMFQNAPRAYLMGVGTTFFICQMAQYLFSSLSQRYFPAISADEFNGVVPVVSDDLVLAVSQSGETFDTKFSLNSAREKGARTAAIVNVMGSSISRLVDHVIMQGSGPEICVVSTKAALAQALLLLRTALELGFREGCLDSSTLRDHVQELETFPELISKLLNEKSGFLRNLARTTSSVQNWIFLGCGIYFPVAMESALKMKEVTYLHAEGMPAGFLKHGTLSMIEASVHSLFFIPPPADVELHNRTMIAIEEIKTRGGTLVGLHFEGDSQAASLLDHAVALPEVPLLLAPFVEMILAQMFAYYTALDLKRNIDKPRNLAKSVTVG
ncbi:MAG: glutamine--fructose-6-phosphate transaminase (isomerizing) [SAR324 cluster bacterium]|nr:glutamine--fructose-6-phosphate transaminase (isomerizing) [SAR324 cluster bacterium]